MAWTPTILNIKDAAGTTQPVIAYTDGTNFSFAHPILDNTGTIIAPATQGTLASVLTAVTGATPAGAAIIGKVTTDQTTHGTTDLVAADITKVGGSAVALGQVAMASSFPVVLASNQSAIPSSVPSVNASAAYAHTASVVAYVFGQLWANNTVAGNVTFGTVTVAKANNQAFTIIGGTVRKSGTVTTNALFRIHFFNAAPTTSLPDYGAFGTGVTLANWIGAMDVNTSITGSDGTYGTLAPVVGSSITNTPVSGAQTIYFAVEVRGAYTPVSAETLTVTLAVA